jgi:undecaprenyl-diphosphatase
VFGLIGGVLLSWRARSVIPGIVVIGTVGAAALAVTAIKAVVETPRIPTNLQSPHVVELGHHSLVTELHPLAQRLHWLGTFELLPTAPNSFPSGHVTGTGALVGMIAVCVGVSHGRAVRAGLGGLVCVSVLVVAVSRLYLRVHWLTDVIGGAILAGVFVTLGACVLSALHSRSSQEGPLHTKPVIEPAVKIH